MTTLLSALLAGAAVLTAGALLLASLAALDLNPLVVVSGLLMIALALIVTRIAGR